MKRLLIILCLLCLISLVPQRENFRTDVEAKFLPPSLSHPLGTDYLGRDLFALMTFGFKRTAQAVFIASIFALSLGLLCGLFAGYRGGLALSALEFFSHLGLVLPSFILALIVSSFFGFGPLSIGLSLGVFDLSGYAIQVATLTRKVKTQDFVIISRQLGLSEWRIFKNHIFHHVFGPVSAAFANKASSIVLRYASLAFLGLGADVTKPDWGMLLYEYRIYFISAPRLLLWPSLGIFAFCLFFHLLFDRKEVFNGGLS